MAVPITSRGSLPVRDARRLVRGERRIPITGDQFFHALLLGIGSLLLVLLAMIFVVLFYDARSALATFGLRFVTGQNWNPPRQIFEILPYIFGTLFTSVIALVVCTPIALGAALFTVEYAPLWLRGPISFIVELLAAIPSIVYGLWGFFVLTPFMRAYPELWLKNSLGNIPGLNQLVEGPAIGKDMLTAGVVLAIMILPTVMSVSREVIQTVPDTQREGMLALGATKWEMLRDAVLPYARGGVIGAAMLGLGRALGETMAVTMVIGNSSSKISPSLFTPGYTMASALANQFNEADSPLYFSSVVGVAFVLLLVAGLVNLVARLIVSRFGAGSPLDTRHTGI